MFFWFWSSELEKAILKFAQELILETGSPKHGWNQAGSPYCQTQIPTPLVQLRRVPFAIDGATRVIRQDLKGCSLCHDPALLVAVAQPAQMVVSWNRGTPKSSSFNGIFHYKSSIWGDPYLWKPPYFRRNWKALCWDLFHQRWCCSPSGLVFHVAGAWGLVMPNVATGAQNNHLTSKNNDVNE